MFVAFLVVYRGHFYKCNYNYSCIRVVTYLFRVLFRIICNLGHYDATLGPWEQKVRLPSVTYVSPLARIVREQIQKIQVPSLSFLAINYLLQLGIVFV